MKKGELIRGFTELGMKKGMTLEVHSSLSSFGLVDGSADTVIQALIESEV